MKNPQVKVAANGYVINLGDKSYVETSQDAAVARVQKLDQDYCSLPRALKLIKDAILREEKSLDKKQATTV